MYTLGVNAAYHDPAACLICDGAILAAAEEERFTHIKHGKRPVPFSTWELPFNAIHYCLRQAGIGLKDVDHVAYSYDPFLLLGARSHDRLIELPLEPSAHPLSDEWESVWDPLFLSSIVNAPRHLAAGAPHHLAEPFREISGLGPYRWHFVKHHLAHAASAFLPSPYDAAAVMTLDGRGEKATTTYAIGQGIELTNLGHVNMPHSLGILYEQVTSYLGFLHSSDEYKVMALASYGRPAFIKDFQEIVRLGDRGQYTIENVRLEERFGPARLRGGPLDQRHFDVAHSLQQVLEDTVLEICTWLHRESGQDDLCLAGGVALNCVMNARIRDRGPFRRIWVQPAAGDAGTALGAAAWIDAQMRAAGRSPYRMDHAFLGPEYPEHEIEQFLQWSQLPYRRMANVAEETADILVQDKVIGWYQGRMEFGPRALGGRSILASPLHAEMQARLNDIKDREDFRPVAPVVLEEEVDNWFVGGHVAPFMLFIFDVQGDKADRIPAVRHVDGTARVQTINRDQNAPYYDLIKAFQKRTGVPVLVNTSFNTRGEPVVCSPRDAVESFWTSPLDALVIGPFLLEKHGARQ
ncbi:MAG: carbamoyltransferase [Pirellulales bacterium]|nr:carbamoyltransferase [Pirellulales bacterium]